MISDLILRVTYDGKITDLPVDSTVPLRLDMSAVENQEIGLFFGIGSQTFDLPGTRSVNRFFKHAYDIGADDIPAFYNTVPCSVILNGETLLQGQLQLLEVISSDDGYVGYKVQVTDKVIQFKQAISNKLITNADFSAYDHNLTTDFITSSWYDNRGTSLGDPPLEGAIFYPLCDLGTDNVVPYPYQPKIFIDDNLTGIPGGVTTGSISWAGTPMLLKQFQPAIRVPELLDVIFAQGGFSYTSSFVDTQCQDMYVYTKAQEGLGPVVDITDQQFLVYTTSSNQNFVVFQPGGSAAGDLIKFNDIIYGPPEDWNQSLWAYVAPVTGMYGIKVNASVEFEAPTYADPTKQNSAILRFGRGGLDGVNTGQIKILPGTYIRDITLETSIFMEAGDPYYAIFVIDNDAGANGDYIARIQTNGTYMSIPQPAVNYYDIPIDMSQQFDIKVKTIDMLKGFLTHFNLVVVPEPNQPSVLRVEPFDDWMRSGTVKDWTTKFSSAKRIGINHTVDEQPQQIVFTSAKDVDRISKVTIDNIPNYQYGTVRTLSTSNLAQGEKTIESFFAPVIPAPMITGSFYLDSNSATTPVWTNDFGTSVSIVPHLYKFDNNVQTTYKWTPRLGYKVTGITTQDNTGDSKAIYLQDSGSTVATVTGYSTLSNVSMVNPLYEYPFTSGQTQVSTTSRDLNFSGDVETYTPASYFPSASITGSSDYTNYWETYIESLYWEGSKKVTLDLFFEPYEYKQIQLNDKILIKNQAYRINKISGFNVSNRDVVTVELIKLYPEYWNAVQPLPPPDPVTFDVSSSCSGLAPTYGKIFITNIVDGGSDVYVGYNTAVGDPVTYATTAAGNVTDYTFDSVPNYTGSYNVYVYNNTTTGGGVESLADNVINCVAPTNAFINGGSTDYGLIIFGSGTGPGSNDWHNNGGTLTISQGGVGSAVYEFAAQGLSNWASTPYVIGPADSVVPVKVRCRTGNSTNLQAGIKFKLTNLAETLQVTTVSGVERIYITDDNGATKYYHNTCSGQNTTEVQTTVDITLGDSNCDGLETGGRTGIKVGGGGTTQIRLSSGT